MNDLNDKGFFSWKPGDGLVELIISNEKTLSHYFHPTEHDIVFACGEHGLPYERVAEVVRDIRRDSHTIFINVPVFLKGEAKKNEDELIDAAMKTIEKRIKDGTMSAKELVTFLRLGCD